MKSCKKCHKKIDDDEHEQYKGMCDNCDRFTVRERSPGLEMTRDEWENFLESE